MQSLSCVQIMLIMTIMLSGNVIADPEPRRLWYGKPMGWVSEAGVCCSELTNFEDIMYHFCVRYVQK